MAKKILKAELIRTYLLWKSRAEKAEAERDNWRETAAQQIRNVDFYRGLLDQAAYHLGPAVYTADNGSHSEEPLRLKIPALVSQLTAERDAYRDTLEHLHEHSSDSNTRISTGTALAEGKQIQEKAAMMIGPRRLMIGSEVHHSRYGLCVVVALNFGVVLRPLTPAGKKQLTQEWWGETFIVRDAHDLTPVEVKS